MDKIAFIFAGQGAQKIGMAKEFYDNIPSVKQELDKLEKLRCGTLSQMWNGDIEELSKTINTQPALFIADYVAAKVLIDRGIKPDVVAGFSLGEIPALTIANCISLEEGFSLVQKRAECTHKTSLKVGGEMLAVTKLSFEEIETICKEFNKVYPVNYNTKYQTVLAGDRDELESVAIKIKQKKGIAIKLRVTGAFHSPYMKEAKKELEKYLINTEFSKPICEVYSNVTAKPYAEGEYKKLLCEQLVSPVLWRDTIINMINYGVDTFIEVGVGKVLTNMVKKIIKEEDICDKGSIYVDYVENMVDLERVMENVKK